MDITRYQARTAAWMNQCFGTDYVHDKRTRMFRFLEESLELAQSLGCTAEQANALVGYVFGRPVGEIPQEVGGVMVTLASLCAIAEISLADAAESELFRVETPEIMAKIRSKQQSKNDLLGPLP